METSAKFLRHEPCPSCNSKDNLARYDDNHAYCFGCQYYEHAEQQTPIIQNTNMIELTEQEYKPIISRKIKIDTCKKYNYKFAKYKNELVHVADYGNGAYKLRFKDKRFSWLGDAKNTGLFGEHLFRNSGKRLTLVEGELDCLSVSQVYGNQWPCVSLKNGAHSAVKDVTKSLEFLSSYNEIIICFDQDEPGIKAAKQVAELFQPGQAKIATLPMKDANEMLVADRTKELLNCLWDAKVFRPDGIVEASELLDKVVNKEVVETINYPFPSINIKTKGLRKGELVTVTAGTGIGKSQFCRELAYHLIKEKKKIGYIALEESIQKSAESLLSLELNTPLHLTTEKIDKKKLTSSFKNLFNNGNVLLYNHFGSLEQGHLISKIRYLAKALQCEYIFLDHLSIVISGNESGDERRNLDAIMTGLRSLVSETGIGLIVVSHLRRTFNDKGHEEGASTSLGQLRGSHGIAQLSDIVLGLERNQQSAKTQNLTSVRVLKNRWSGETGLCGRINYDPTTGRLQEHEEI